MEIKDIEVILTVELKYCSPSCSWKILTCRLPEIAETLGMAKLTIWYIIIKNIKEHKRQLNLVTKSIQVKKILEKSNFIYLKVQTSGTTEE